MGGMYSSGMMWSECKAEMKALVEALVTAFGGTITADYWDQTAACDYE